VPIPLGSSIPSRPLHKSGFARQDLMAVLGTVSLLGGLLFVTLGSSSGRLDYGFQCASNLRQLSAAWLMYADDNDGRLPRCYDPSPGRAWIWGALDYNGSNTDNTNTLNLVDPQRATMGPYARDPALFHCPADSSSVRRSGVLLPRVRSYSMSEAMGQETSGWLPSPAYRTFLKRDDITAPSPGHAWVFIEEHPDSINDSEFAVQMAEASRPSDSRIIDFPAAYHDSGANLAFADGHVELRIWLDPRTKPAVRIGSVLSLNVASPSNRDVLWLSQHTSSRRR
jgi:prepilin-type processing-associated H-X9-DG protein